MTSPNPINDGLWVPRSASGREPRPLFKAGILVGRTLTSEPRIRQLSLEEINWWWHEDLRRLGIQLLAGDNVLSTRITAGKASRGSGYPEISAELSDLVVVVTKARALRGGALSPTTTILRDDPVLDQFKDAPEALLCLWARDVFSEAVPWHLSVTERLNHPGAVRRRKVNGGAARPDQNDLALGPIATSRGIARLGDIFVATPGTNAIPEFDEDGQSGARELALRSLTRFVFGPTPVVGGDQREHAYPLLITLAASNRPPSSEHNPGFGSDVIELRGALLPGFAPPQSLGGARPVWDPGNSTGGEPNVYQPVQLLDVAQIQSQPKDPEREIIPIPVPLDPTDPDEDDPDPPQPDRPEPRFHPEQEREIDEDPILGIPEGIAEEIEEAADAADPRDDNPDNQDPSDVQERGIFADPTVTVTDAAARAGLIATSPLGGLGIIPVTAAPCPVGTETRERTQPATETAEDAPELADDSGADVTEETNGDRYPTHGNPIDLDVPDLTPEDLNVHDRSAKQIQNMQLPKGLRRLPKFGTPGAPVDMRDYVSVSAEELNALADIVDAALIGARAKSYGGNIAIMFRGGSGHGMGQGSARNVIGCYYVDPEARAIQPDGQDPTHPALLISQVVESDKLPAIANRVAAEIERILLNGATATKPILQLQKRVADGSDDKTPWIRCGGGAPTPTGPEMPAFLLTDTGRAIMRDGFDVRGIGRFRQGRQARFFPPAEKTLGSAGAAIEFSNQGPTSTHTQTFRLQAVPGILGVATQAPSAFVLLRILGDILFRCYLPTAVPIGTPPAALTAYGFGDVHDSGDVISRKKYWDGAAFRTYAFLDEVGGGGGAGTGTIESYPSNQWFSGEVAEGAAPGPHKGVSWHNVSSADYISGGTLDVDEVRDELDGGRMLGYHVLIDDQSVQQLFRLRVKLPSTFTGFTGSGLTIKTKNPNANTVRLTVRVINPALPPYTVLAGGTTTRIAVGPEAAYVTQTIAAGALGAFGGDDELIIEYGFIGFGGEAGREGRFSCLTLEGTGLGSGGGHLTGRVVWVDPVNGIAVPVVGDPAQSSLTIQAAITAASAGDTVLILPGVYSEQIILKDGVSLSALIPGSVTINDTVTAGPYVALTTAGTVAAPVVMSGINIVASPTSGASPATAVLYTVATSDFRLENCFIQAAGASPGGRGVVLDSGAGVSGRVTMEDVRFLISTPGVNAIGWAVGGFGGGDWRIKNCSFDGPSNVDVSSPTGFFNVLEMVGCRLKTVAAGPKGIARVDGSTWDSRTITGDGRFERGGPVTLPPRPLLAGGFLA